MRLGLLSTAAISRALLEVRSPDASFEIVAVGSRELARAEAFAREDGIPRAHGSYDDLLADEDVDAVYVALPNELHHEWTVRALRAGKHVLVEKPFTRRPELVEDACDEAERRGLVLEEAYMWRHSRQTALLRELLPAVGEIQGVHATFFGALDDPDDVRFVRELGGGALLDLGCYCVGAARLVLGEPEQVQAEATFGRGGVDERFAGTLRFREVTATFQCGFAGSLDRIEVVGADGVLAVPHAFVDPTGVVLLNGEEHRAEPENHYRAELEDFAAAVRGERAVLNGRAEMLGQAHVLDALLRAVGR